MTTHKILDVAFYDADTLSVLLEEEDEATPILVQLPISAAERQMTSVSTTTLALTSDPLVKHPDVNRLHVDLQTHEGVMLRRLENMRGSAFAVSGTRKVACVLFSSRRRVRLFIMDAEDEEDEEDDEDDENNDTAADVSHVTPEGQPMTDEDEDKENSRESGGMDL